MRCCTSVKFVRNKEGMAPSVAAGRDPQEVSKITWNIAGGWKPAGEQCVLFNLLGWDL